MTVQIGSTQRRQKIHQRFHKGGLAAAIRADYPNAVAPAQIKVTSASG